MPHPLFRQAGSDSSDAEAEPFTSGESDDQDIRWHAESGDSSFSGESDSAGEKVLITASYKTATQKSRTQTKPTNTAIGEELRGQEIDPSSQVVTLSEVMEQTLTGKSKRSTHDKRPQIPKRQPQRGVLMREELLAEIGLPRSFISGPADPIHNQHMVCCHMSKKTFSVKSKGPLDILRHHRTEKHLRRDQRWRYEHLRSVDPMSRQIQHRVKGRKGKVLSKIEVAREFQNLFTPSWLVDIGERFPFYDDFTRGRTTPLVTPESRAKTQLCLVGEFIPSHGHLSVLRIMWAKISSFTDHQVTLCDFDWGEERVTRSISLKNSIAGKSHLVLGSIFPFQAIFQHFFNCAMNAIAEHVPSEQCFGLEFEDRGASRFMSLRFWKGQELC